MPRAYLKPDVINIKSNTAKAKCLIPTNMIKKMLIPICVYVCVWVCLTACVYVCVSSSLVVLSHLSAAFTRGLQKCELHSHRRPRGL